jgi:ribosomal protein S18 acetylase RimI-like enzyme
VSFSSTALRARGLGRRLPLGRLRAVQADEACLSRLAGCVRDCRDYFARAARGDSAERVAAELLSDALADPARRLFLLEDDTAQVVGLLDLALDAPEPGEATLALLVLAPRRRGLGLGREAAEGACAALACAGYRRLRLGVARGESQAAHFWAAVGMWECGEDGGVRLFERPL